MAARLAQNGAHDPIVALASTRGIHMPLLALGFASGKVELLYMRFDGDPGALRLCERSKEAAASLAFLENPDGAVSLCVGCGDAEVKIWRISVGGEAGIVLKREPGKTGFAPDYSTSYEEIFPHSYDSCRRSSLVVSVDDARKRGGKRERVPSLVLFGPLGNVCVTYDVENSSTGFNLSSHKPTSDDDSRTSGIAWDYDDSRKLLLYSVDVSCVDEHNNRVTKKSLRTYSLLTESNVFCVDLKRGGGWGFSFLANAKKMVRAGRDRSVSTHLQYGSVMSMSAIPSSLDKRHLDSKSSLLSALSSLSSDEDSNSGTPGSRSDKLLVFVTSKDRVLKTLSTDPDSGVYREHVSEYRITAFKVTPEYVLVLTTRDVRVLSSTQFELIASFKLDPVPRFDYGLPYMIDSLLEFGVFYVDDVGLHHLT